MSSTDASSDQSGAEVTVEREQRSERFEAAEETMPEGPTDLHRRGWKATLKRTVSEFSRKGGTDLAAALTYYSVLSLFPAMLALTSLLGVLGQGEATTAALLDVLRDLGVSDEQLEPIQDYLDTMQTAGGAGLALVIGVAGALWAASNYVNAFSRVMNRVYDVTEGRPVWKLRPWMLLITLVVLLLVMAVGLSLVFTGGIAQAVGAAVGLGETAVMVWNIAKWPVMFLIVVLIVALLYWGTPNVRQPKFRWLSPGALLAIVVWAVATAGFGFYVSNFGNYNATYGALAGVIMLLLWLWLTNTSLVFGAVFDAELERGRELQSGLPAEETLQLPPRDTRQSEKQLQKQADLVAESRRIRLLAEREQ